MTESNDAEESPRQRNTRLLRELTGGQQRWLLTCQDFLQHRSPMAWATLEDGSTASRALREQTSDVAAGPARSILDQPLESRHWLVARGLRELTLSLTGGSAEEARRADLIRHLTDNGLLSPGSGSENAKPLVDLAISELLRTPPQVSAHASLPVLTAGEHRDDNGAVTAQGKAATLELCRRSEGPPGLHPDPARMLFCRLDPAFLDSLQTAWSTSAMADTDACITWSVTDREASGDPFLNLEGGSFGAALGILLDDLSRHGWRRFLRSKLLDSQAAVTATLEPDRDLGPVSGYEQKFVAARRAGIRVVVARAGLDSATREPSHTLVSLQAAGTLDEAITEVRQHRNPRVDIIKAVALALLVALVAGSAWWQAQRVSNSAHQIALIAQQLANSDPQRAAQYALTADVLHHSPATTDALRVVLQNNPYVLASRQVTERAIRGAATTQHVAFVTDDTKTIHAVNWPALSPIRDIQTTHPQPRVTTCRSDLIAVLDGDELALYLTTPNDFTAFGDPIRQPGVPIVPETGLPPARVVGLYCDAQGGVLTLASNFVFAYWSPLTGRSVVGNLRLIPRLSALRANVEITDGSGFAPNTSPMVDRTPLNGATNDQFAFATSDGQIWRLELSGEPAGSGESTTEAASKLPYMVSSITQREGTNALGWWNNSLILGGDQGVSTAQSWDTAPPAVTGQVRSIAHGQTTAVVTSNGMTLLTPRGPLQLGNVSSTRARDQIALMTAQIDAGTERWLVGRDNGQVQVLEPTRVMGWDEVPTTGVSPTPTAEGSIILTSGPPMDAQALLELLPDGKQLARLPLNEELGTNVYINAIANNGAWVAASGTTAGKRGFINLWERGTATNKVIYFGEDTDPAFAPDIVSQVSINAAARTVTALNPFRQQVATWNLDTLVEIGRTTATSTSTGPGGMSTTTDGSIVAIQEGTTLQLLDTTSHQPRQHLTISNSRAELSPDGRSFIQPQGNGLLHSSTDGITTNRITGLAFEPSRIAWAPDSTHVIVAAEGGSQIAVVDVIGSQITAVSSIPLANEEVFTLSWLNNSSALVGIASQKGSVWTPSRLLLFSMDTKVDPKDLCPLAAEPIPPQDWRGIAGFAITQPSWPC